MLIKDLQTIISPDVPHPDLHTEMVLLSAATIRVQTSDALLEHSVHLHALLGQRHCR